MQKLKNIHPYIILVDTFRNFLYTCGFVLILYLLNFLPITNKVEFLPYIEITFLNVMVCTTIYEILFDNRWVSKPSTKNLNSINTEDPFIKISTFHEAGHAMMCYLKNIEMNYIEIGPFVSSVYTINNNLEANNMQDFIMMIYSGAIAEELFLGEFHLGCMDGDNNDFGKATKIIRQYLLITNHNLSKTFLDKELESMTIELSKTLYQKTYDLLISNKDKMQRLAAALQIKNKISAKEAISIFENAA